RDPRLAAHAAQREVRAARRGGSQRPRAVSPAVPTVHSRRESAHFSGVGAYLGFLSEGGGRRRYSEGPRVGHARRIIMRESRTTRLGSRRWWRSSRRDTGPWWYRLAREDRGDIPGWVMVVVMTAGLVILIWAIAGDA